MKTPKTGSKSDKAEDKKAGVKDTKAEDMAEMKKKMPKTVLSSAYRSK